MAPCRDRPDDDIPVLLLVPTYYTTLASVRRHPLLQGSAVFRAHFLLLPPTGDVSSHLPHPRAHACPDEKNGKSYLTEFFLL